LRKATVACSGSFGVVPPRCAIRLIRRTWLINDSLIAEREINLPYICCMSPRKRFHVFLDNVLVVILGLFPLLAM